MIVDMHKGLSESYCTDRLHYTTQWHCSVAMLQRMEKVAAFTMYMPLWDLEELLECRT